MKIIISPSKTAVYERNSLLVSNVLLFPKKTEALITVIKKLSKNELGKALSIKGNILEQTYNNYLTYDSNDTFHAFQSFTGLVYKQLSKDDYKKSEYKYIENHLRILDSLYGILTPGTLIKPYRLDMKTKLGLNLYNHWDLNDYFKDELIINLASNEFSKMLNIPMISISFLQNNNGTLKPQATYSKMARGKLLDYMIKNKTKSINQIKQWQDDGYHYSEEHSNDQTITFLR